jgi:hypothetical protein
VLLFPVVLSFITIDTAFHTSIFLGLFLSTPFADMFRYDDEIRSRILLLAPVLETR